VHYLGTPVTATVDRVELRTSSEDGPYTDVYYHYVLNDCRFKGHNNGMNVTSEEKRVGAQILGNAVSAFGRAMFVPASISIARDILLVVVFTLFWNGILSIFIYVVWVSPIRMRRVAKMGTAVGGTITSKRMIPARGTRYVLKYQFVTADGQTIDATSDISESAFDRAVKGRPVTVLYNPRRPKWNLPYEYGDFTISPPPQIG
jgi:hypothetical protein